MAARLLAQRALNVRYLGLIPYDEALAIQRATVEGVTNETMNDTLLLLEHPPVYTVGRKVPINEHEEKRLTGLGAEYKRTLRGGDITFHGPGQLVGYPILNLTRFVEKSSVREYVHQLEAMLMDTCADFGVTTSRSADTGVWVGNAKIAALGVQVSRRVTSHGFALNCSTDLAWFGQIVPCGLVGKGVTSLTKETKQVVTIQDVLPNLTKRFGERFSCEMINTPSAAAFEDKRHPPAPAL